VTWRQASPEPTETGTVSRRLRLVVVQLARIACSAAA
jgi:hypothetical protein